MKARKVFGKPRKQVVAQLYTLLSLQSGRWGAYCQCIFHYYENIMAKNMRREMATTVPKISRDLTLSNRALLFAFLLDFWKRENKHFQFSSPAGVMMTRWRSNTWKITVPCSSFSARDSISCSFPSLILMMILWLNHVDDNDNKKYKWVISESPFKQFLNIVLHDMSHLSHLGNS